MNRLTTYDPGLMLEQLKTQRRDNDIPAVLDTCETLIDLCKDKQGVKHNREHTLVARENLVWVNQIAWDLVFSPPHQDELLNSIEKDANLVAMYLAYDYAEKTLELARKLPYPGPMKFDRPYCSDPKPTHNLCIYIKSLQILLPGPSKYSPDPKWFKRLEHVMRKHNVGHSGYQGELSFGCQVWPDGKIKCWENGPDLFPFSDFT